MPRKIDEKLIERLVEGDLRPLLNFIKSEPKVFRLEVRKGGKAFVYYRKCKILEVGRNSYKIDKKYFENSRDPGDIKDMVVNNPKRYFEETLSVVDKWLLKHPKEEFKTQQGIAYTNQDKNGAYIVLDMEYNFSQAEVEGGNRVKRAGFDLLGIERRTGRIVFFEVKKGLKALIGNAGIKSHIADFEECLYGRNKDLFRKNLITDIGNIINDKKRLGLIDNTDIPSDFSKSEFELIFVFEPVNCNEQDYWRIYRREYQKSASTRLYRTVFVSTDNLKLT